MEVYQDAIPHYLKSDVNINNSTDTYQTTKTSPTLQVNMPNIRPVNLISSDNIARSSSFKSFENIQQSHKRSCTDSGMDNMD